MGERLAGLGPQPADYCPEWEDWATSVFRTVEMSIEATSLNPDEALELREIVDNFRLQIYPNADGDALQSVAERYGHNLSLASLLASYCSCRLDTLAKLIGHHKDNPGFKQLLETHAIDPADVVRRERELVRARPEALAEMLAAAADILTDFGIHKRLSPGIGATYRQAAVHVDSQVLELVSGGPDTGRVIVEICGHKEDAAAALRWRISSIRYDMFDDRLSRYIRLKSAAGLAELHFRDQRQPDYQLLSETEVRSLLVDIRKLHDLLSEQAASILPHY